MNALPRQHQRDPLLLPLAILTCCNHIILALPPHSRAMDGNGDTRLDGHSKDQSVFRLIAFHIVESDALPHERALEVYAHIWFIDRQLC